MTVSVVVPTRGRPEHARECVASILDCDGEFTVTVVDQSDDKLTRDAISSLGDPRVTHLLTDTRGAANARNVGAAATDGELIAFTDDDCRVDRGWVSELQRAFTADSVGMVFGGVVSGPTDDPKALAAEFLPTAVTTYSSLPPVSEPWGISASVAIRRSAFERVAGFDTMLGPGAPINTGGEDSDMFIRVLAAGYQVRATDATKVTHLGFRSGDDAAALFRGYATALGAVFAKHIRLRTRPGREQLPKWLFHFSLEAAGNILKRRRPTGAAFVIGLVKGAAKGARLPVDRSTGKFA